MKCRAMTRIMQICMVLMVVVSVFFYAPMEVSAEEVSYNYDGSVTTTLVSRQIYIYRDLDNPIDTSFFDGLSPNSYYRVDFSGNISVSSSVSIGLNTTSLVLNFDGQDILLFNRESGTTATHWSNDFSGYFIIQGSSSPGIVYDYISAFASRSTTSGLEAVLSYDLSLNFDSITELIDSESDDYQNGYNTGYSDGESVGYGNGYSQGFADGESSVDTNEIYNQGFNAGKESVDTQSYYDAGYQAGYQVAYQEGYDSGYDEGYQSAMDRIDGWGADTTDYPVLLLDKPLMSRVFDLSVKSSIPTQYSDFGEWTTDLVFNPNHTYRFNVVLNPTEYKEGSADIYFLNEDIFYLNVGGIKYRISNFSTAYVNTFFVPGNRMSSAFSFSWEPLLAVMGDTFESGSAYCYYDLNYQIYDMGPSGDTQNHIANQTDQLTNGYDSSQGAAVNDDFNASVNEYHTAEDSLFSTATTSLENFTFLDFTSITGMVTSLSFVTSIMTSIYMAMGGDTGASGIILAVLFSVMLVSMAIGLYRYYVSNGKSDGSGKGGD